MPKRIQRKRTKGFIMPPNTVYVGRPSKWGNPFSIQECGSPEAAVREFEKFIEKNYELKDRIASELRGKDLACWCPLDQPCHVDVLLKIANRNIVGFCLNCAKKRLVKNIGEYTYEGVEYPIALCQWCRAANTRRKKSEEPRTSI